VQWVPGLSRGKERPGRDADSSPLLMPWSRKSRATPLLPVWAVQPVQSLSACTRVHCVSCLRISNILNNISYSFCEPVPYLTMTAVDSRNMYWCPINNQIHMIYILVFIGR